jgi:hypothetical protein
MSTEITEEMLNYWADYMPVVMDFTPPSANGPDNCETCRAIVTTVIEGDVAHQVVRVPYVLDDEAKRDLINGGTLWLSTWNGLPPHMIHVQGPDDEKA